MSVLRITKSISAGVVLIAAIGGCAATAAPPEPYRVADPVPSNLRTYPQVVYDGHPVYLVGTRWYFRSEDRWVYYREEPEELYRQRTVFYRERPYTHDSPANRTEHAASQYPAPVERPDGPTFPERPPDPVRSASAAVH